MKTHKSFKKKMTRLAAILKHCQRAVIAFSGGKDSFFLVKTAIDILGKENVIPFFITTPFTPESSQRRLAYFRRMAPVEISKISIDLLQNKRITMNPRNRCYLCKRMMFSALKAEAARLGIPYIMDGTTLSDHAEFRPGRKALAELGIRSPLKEAGITSDEILDFLVKRSLKREFLHSTTCLATRFPYDYRLKREEIQKIACVEDYLLKKKISPVRVRYMDQGVRIETAPENFSHLIAQRASLLKLCRALGFTFITFDLAGFRSGSWDQADLKN